MAIVHVILNMFSLYHIYWCPATRGISVAAYMIMALIQAMASHLVSARPLAKLWSTMPTDAFSLKDWFKVNALFYIMQFSITFVTQPKIHTFKQWQ